MTRTAWIAIFLLVASNLAWLAASWSADPGPEAPAFVQAEMEQTIDALREEVRVLRARSGGDDPEAPLLIGRAGDAARPDAPEGSSDAPAPTPGTPEEAGAAASPAAEERAEQAARAAEVRQEMVAILRKIMQVKDAALRTEGLAELRTAMASTDPLVVEYAVSTLFQLDKVDLDTSVFRRQVLDLLDSENAGIRRSALYALHTTGVEAGDVRRALAAAADADGVVRRHAARVLSLYNEGRFEGEAAAALVALLGDEDLDVRRGTLRALENAHVTPEAEQTLVELAARPAERRETLQFGLAPLADKSRAVVDALLTYLADEDHGVRAHAHRGLQRGVRDEDKPYVARGYARHLETFLTPQSHKEALKIIARFGDAGLAPTLDGFARNELVDASVREMAAKVAEYLRRK